MNTNISPMQLLGTPKVFSTKEMREKPIIACGKKYFWQDVVEINIQKLELKKMVIDKKEVPGVMINEGSPEEMFVTMDDKSLHIDRSFCIALAKGINTKTLNEIIDAKDEAERSYNEYDEAAKKLGLIVTHMK